jgi:competence protein ComEC
MPFSLFAAGAALLAVATWLAHPRRRPWLAMGAIWWTGATAHRAQELPRFQDRPAAELLEGTVVDVLTSPLGRQLLLRDVALQGSLAPTSGTPSSWLTLTAGVRLSLRAPSAGSPRIGDTIRTKARLHRPQGFCNPGAADPERRAAVDGIFAVGTSSGPVLSLGSPLARHRQPSLLPPWVHALVLLPRRALRGVRDALVANLHRAIPPTKGRALIEVMVLGEKAEVPPTLWEQFRRAGVIHVLSVSGLHLACVAWLALGLLRALLGGIGRLLPGAAVRFPPHRAAAAAALPIVWAYTELTGGAAATVRAAAMVTIALLATLAGRRPQLGTTLAAAALVMLLVAPASTFDLSLQLSFAAVVGLAALPAPRWPWMGASTHEPPLASLHLPGLLRRATRAAASAGAGLLWAAAASLATTGPLSAQAFGELGVAGLWTNLLVIPLAELALVPVCLAGSLVSLVSQRGAAPLFQLGHGLAQATCWVVQQAADSAPSLPQWRPGLLGVAAAWLAALLLVHRPRCWPIAVALVSLEPTTSGLHRLWERRQHQAEPTLYVTFLDVGQGDSALVELPPRGGREPERILIDGGGALPPGGRDPGVWAVVPYLRHRGIHHLDVVVVSHPHPDHVGGLFALLGDPGGGPTAGSPAVSVGELWMADVAEGDDRGPLDRAIRELARRRRIPVVAPRTHRRGPITIDVLHPYDPAAAPAHLEVSQGAAPRMPPTLGDNDASLVLRIGLGRSHVLFPGDVEHAGEEILTRYRAQQLDANVLKVPHHASRTSSSLELLRAVHPQLAVASLAQDNLFGFPHREVLERYRAAGVPLLRTDRAGAVRIALDPQGHLTTTVTRPRNDGTSRCGG